MYDSITFFNNLKDIVYSSANNKFINLNNNVVERIEYELDYIENHNLTLFFISLSKIFQKLRSKNIFVSSYSSLSSMICYLLNISEINPIDYDLLSERVFNEKTKFNNFIIYSSSEAINCVKTWIADNIKILNKTPNLELKIKEIFVLNNDVELLNKLIIQAKNKKNKHINPNEISLTDYNTIRLFQEGKTENIPNFSSAEIRNILTKIKPEKINDLLNVFVLNQPGSNQLLPIYINQQNNKKLPKIIANILEDTKGLILFQEQFITILQKTANFTKEDSLQLLNGFRKRQTAYINEYKQIFISSYKKSFSTNTILRSKNKEAEYVWQFLMNFNNIFHKSYALHIVLTSYKIAYLKLNYNL